LADFLLDDTWFAYAIFKTKSQEVAEVSDNSRSRGSQSLMEEVMIKVRGSEKAACASPLESFNRTPDLAVVTDPA
jgi:hypothetical protein